MSDALTTLLRSAVPLWIERVKMWPREYREQRTRVCMHAMHLAMEAKQDPTLSVLCEGLALMSFLPGGAEFAGMKWETLPWNEEASAA